MNRIPTPPPVPVRSAARLTARFAAGLLLIGTVIAAPRAVAANGSSEPAAATERLPHDHEPAPGLITGGEPSPDQLRALAEQGVETVISLRTDAEPVAIGRAEVEALGMRWIQVPVSGPDDLTRDKVAAFAAALDAAGDDPKVVYCASGNRVGAMFALKSAWIDGKSPAEALAFGEAAGLTRLEPKVRELLEIPEGE